MKAYIQILVLVTFLITSCAQDIAYKAIESNNHLPISYESRIIHLVLADKAESNLYMTNVTIQDSLMTGYLQTFLFSPYSDRSQLVNVILDNSIVLPDSLPIQYQIPTQKIIRVEEFEIDEGRALVSFITGIVAVGLITIGVLSLLVH